jgi:hypothetical protein
MSQKSCTRGHPKKKIRQRVKRAKTSVAKRNVNVCQDCKHPSDLKKVSALPHPIHKLKQQFKTKEVQVMSMVKIINVVIKCVVKENALGKKGK